MKISGIMIGTENAKKLAEFYTKVLGKPGWDDGDWYGYEKGASIVIGPHSEVKGQSQNPQRIMISFNSDNVKKDFDAMKAAGAKVVAEPYQPQASKMPDTWLATVADPDGNYIQLASPWK